MSSHIQVTLGIEQYAEETSKIEKTPESPVQPLQSYHMSNNDNNPKSAEPCFLASSAITLDNSAALPSKGRTGQQQRLPRCVATQTLSQNYIFL